MHFVRFHLWSPGYYRADLDIDVHVYVSVVNLSCTREGKSNTRSSGNETWFILLCLRGPARSALLLAVSKTNFNTFIKVLGDRLLCNWFEWITSVVTICDCDHEADTAHGFYITIYSNNLWPHTLARFFWQLFWRVRSWHKTSFCWFQCCKAESFRGVVLGTICFCHIDASIQVVSPTDMYFPIMYHCCQKHSI